MTDGNCPDENKRSCARSRHLKPFCRRIYEPRRRDRTRWAPKYIEGFAANEMIERRSEKLSKDAHNRQRNERALQATEKSSTAGKSADAASRPGNAKHRGHRAAQDARTHSDAIRQFIVDKKIMSSAERSGDREEDAASAIDHVRPRWTRSGPFETGEARCFLKPERCRIRADRRRRRS